jgi:hypothetical protein
MSAPPGRRGSGRGAPKVEYAVPGSSRPAMTAAAISSITDIVADLRAGRMVVLVDEEQRENEGDLVLAADFVTPDAINFMA